MKWYKNMTLTAIRKHDLLRNQNFIYCRIIFKFDNQRSAILPGAFTET